MYYIKQVCNKMKKIKLIVFCIFISLIIVLLMFLILIFLNIELQKHKRENATIINVSDDYMSNNICLINNEYYYAKNNSIISWDGNEKLSNINNPLIYCDEQYIYIFSDKVLYKYNADFILIEEYELGIDVISFSVKDNLAFLCDNSYKTSIIDLEKNEEIIIPSEKKSFKINEVEYPENTIEYSETDNMKILSSNNKNIISFFSYAVIMDNQIVNRWRNKQGKYIITQNEDEIFISSSLNSNTIRLYKFNYKNDKYISVDLPNEYTPTKITYDKTNIIFIGTKLPLNPHIPISEVNAIKNHEADCLSIINIDNMQIKKEYKTRKKERLIYTDAEKAITYYKNNYLTYSLDNWTKISSQKATEIQKGNSYYFQTCGDYIFIFDNGGNVINRISVL